METFHAFNAEVNPAFIMGLCGIIALAVMALDKDGMRYLNAGHWRVRVGVLVGSFGFAWYIVAVAVAVILGK